MIPKIVNFIKYNNFFTIAVMFVFLGSGVTLAASPAVRDGVISSEDKVRSIDNSYIIGANVAGYNFNLLINNVTEDAENYYVDYSYRTIAIKDYVWQDVSIQKVLTVNKKSIEGKDLGLFVSDQLGQIIDGQLKYLAEVKTIEINKGLSQKVISTTYSGLVGRMLSPKEKVFAGYNPVIKPAPDLSKVPRLANVTESESERSKSIPAFLQNISRNNEASVQQALIDSEADPSGPLHRQAEIRAAVAKMLEEKKKLAEAAASSTAETQTVVSVGGTSSTSTQTTTASATATTTTTTSSTETSTSTATTTPSTTPPTDTTSNSTSTPPTETPPTTPPSTDTTAPPETTPDPTTNPPTETPPVETPPTTPVENPPAENPTPTPAPEPSGTPAE